MKDKAKKAVQVYGVITTEDDPRFRENKIKVMLWGERRPRNKTSREYKCFSSEEALNGFCETNGITPRKL